MESGTPVYRIHFGDMYTRFQRLRILRPSLLISGIAVLTGVLGLHSTLFAQDELVQSEMEAWALERLPEVIVSRASEILELPTMVSSQLDIATSMVLVSVELGPNSIPAWEKLRQLAIALRGDLENAEELELELARGSSALPLLRLRLLPILSTHLSQHPLP